MGEMDLRMARDPREIEPGVVAETREAIAGAAPVGIHRADDLLGQPPALDKMVHAQRRFVGQGIGAQQEKHFGRAAGQFQLPYFRVLPDEVQPRAHGPEVVEHILADHPHHFPEGLPRGEFLHEGEAAQEGDIDRRVQLVHHFRIDPQPARRDERAAAIEPLRRLKPVAELPGILIES